jgi:hypothetical protein
VIDAHRLLRLATRTDARLGIRESFVRLPVGRASIVGVLAEPIGPAHEVGWVLCHSFGIEQMHLSTMETRIARAVAAAGSPTLRLHGYGYGDSDGAMRDVTLETHVGDIRAGAGALAARGLRVGLIGMRFGAAVAARVAARSDVGDLVLIDPILTGGRFLRDLLRSKVIADMTGESREDWIGPAADADRTPPVVRDGPAANGGGGATLGALRSQGWIDVRGFQLSLRAHEQIQRLELERDLAGSDAGVLLVWLCPSTPLSAAKRELGERLERKAGVEVRTIVDAGAADIGGYHYRFQDDLRAAKVDSQLGLTRQVGALVASWTAARAAAGSEGAGRAV